MKKKCIVSAFSFPREKEEIVEQAEIIAARERLSLSALIISLLETYVKTHASGNPSYEITKWVDQSEFKGDPAVAETNEKWDKYLSQCDDKELARLQGTFNKRSEQAKHAYLRKRGFRK